MRYTKLKLAGNTAMLSRCMDSAGPVVLEIVANEMGDTFRAVYTVKFATAMYVLHAFQKKSKSGIKTPVEDIKLIEQRFKVAEADYRLQLQKGKPS